ncbi:MAG TPA: sigma-70 family RNA polymerase sigma factor [Chitinophaga sp.]|uniref:RNA polymerase sigma factor n=1 Tax=Chitinophaga sp. TaxID=1869181 RepID=UPI002BC23211|nr:sigma-70 family RNA polymerase sigma factor [Chitinophaga sp.]HVI46681.1 sigma-70 family RNA polymerase sigma factor [Chitinophaga sp.]
MGSAVSAYHFHEDEQWLRQMKAGDYTAFTALYNKYIKGLTQYGLKFTADQAIVEDCLHDLFVWCWSKRHELEIQRSFKGYLMKSLRTGLLHRIEKEQRRNIRPITTDENYEFRLILSPEAVLMDREQDSILRERVARLLDQLTARQREVIYLRYYEGLPFEEVARNMNLSVKACYKLMGRAIATLRETLPHSSLILLLWLC